MTNSLSLPAEIVQRICEIVYLDSVPLCSLRLLDPASIPSAAHDGQAVSTSIYETQHVLYMLCLVNRTFYRYAQPLICRRIQFTLPYRFMLLVQAAIDKKVSTLSSIRLLDFSSFRALGLGRTVGESTEHRFVTPERLYTLVHAATGLVAFGSSETMDSALSLEVLEALLLHDGARSRPSRVRDVSMERDAGPVHNALQSLDLCGCISPKFLHAMRLFVEKHLEPASQHRAMYDLIEEDENTDSESEHRGRSRTALLPHHMVQHRTTTHARSRTFPSMQRLGLKGVSLPRDVLASFVLSFPNLTHLDLSETKVDAAMLDALGRSTIQLESLSLSRCRAITSESLVKLLVGSPTTKGLTELALQGTLLFPTPVSQEDARFILTHAPCMQSGALRYLDVGGCQLTDDDLSVVPPQHSLLDLGLGAMPNLTLQGVSTFLLHTAPNVQILDLSHSCATHSQVHAVHLYHDLLAPCTQRPPALAVAEQLREMGIKKDTSEPWHPPTNLRVVELSSSVLGTVRGGVGSWKVIWGAGRRGWVVDTAAGPHPQAFDIPVHTEEPEPYRGRDRTCRQTAGWHPEPPSMSTSVARMELARGHDRERGRSSHRLDRPPTGLSRSNTVFNVPSASFESRSRSLSLSRHERMPSRRMPSAKSEPVQVEPQVLRNLPVQHPRRVELERLSSQNGRVQGIIGWHNHKMEVLLGYGLLGREIGTYAWFAYQAS